MEIIKITESAVKQAIVLFKKDHPNGSEDHGLRMAVKGGGCSGLSYDLKFDEKADKDYEQAISSNINDIGLKLIIDPKSAIYLKDMEVDFDDGLMGKGFVFKNPNATNTCGCGESFSVF